MSPIDICNQALAHIGERRISRLDEDAQITDPLVRYCAEFYETSRREALAAQRWTWAKKAVALVQRAGVTFIGNWTYAHVKPEDCIRVMALVPGAEHPTTGDVTYNGRIDKFRIVGKDIWTNYPLVALEYIGDITDPNQWSPHFGPAVSRLLAHYLAGAIADDPGMALRHREHYEKVDLPNAQFYDAIQDESGENEDRTTRLAGSPLLRARRSSGYSSYGPLDDYGD